MDAAAADVDLERRIADFYACSRGRERTPCSRISAFIVPAGAPAGDRDASRYRRICCTHRVPELPSRETLSAGSAAQLAMLTLDIFRAAVALRLWACPRALDEALQRRSRVCLVSMGISDQRRQSSLHGERDRRVRLLTYLAAASHVPTADTWKPDGKMVPPISATVIDAACDVRRPWLFPANRRRLYREIRACASWAHRSAKVDHRPRVLRRGGEDR